MHVILLFELLEAARLAFGSGTGDDMHGNDMQEFDSCITVLPAQLKDVWEGEVGSSAKL